MKIRLPTVLLDESPSTQYFYRKIERYITQREQSQGAVGWIAIPSQTLATMSQRAGVKGSYKKALERLVGDHKPLLCRNHYRTGRCRMYCVNPYLDNDYLDGTTEVEDFAHSKSMKIEVEYSCSDDWYRTNIKPIYYASLKKCTFDPSANDTINALTIKERHKSLLRDACFGNTRWLKYDHGERVYSSWTNTKREVRKHALLHDEPLVCFDFTNFHPALIAREAEDEKLIAVCEEGLLYELLMTETGEPSRERVKQEMNAVINNKPRATTYRDKKTKRYRTLLVKRAFEHLFPETMAHINQLKHEDHRKASESLRKLEWQVMFPLARAVYREVARPRKKKILPLHDAIYVPASLAEQAEDLLHEQKPPRMTLKREASSQVIQPNKTTHGMTYVEAGKYVF